MVGGGVLVANQANLVEEVVVIEPKVEIAGFTIKRRECKSMDTIRL